MIESLTEEQIAQFPFYRDKWLKNGLNTDPLNKADAEYALEAVYKKHDLPVPPLVYCESPMSMILMAILTREETLTFTKNTREQEFTLEELFTFARANGDLNAKIRTELQNCVYGQHESSWFGFFDYFRNVCNLKKETENIIELSNISQTLNWFAPYDTICFYCERCSHIGIDEQKRLHGEHNGAIEYVDGFASYQWHGTTIPKEWITDKGNLTAKVALTWKNIEQRRAACEILGWANILKELKAEVIDEDGDPEIGTLVEVNIPEIGKERFLRVMCGTGREFALPVPPEMKTALEAQSWTWGIKKDDFKIPEIRT